MVRKHQYGQHFLRSPRVVAELIGHSNIRKNDLVYDLGAGSGVITSVLARRAREVVAVENEPQALALLRKNVGQLENVRIIKQDILRVKLPREPYKIFANIPFQLSSDVVHIFAFAQHPPKSMYLVTQRQFAKKLVPSQRHFNAALGAQLWPWFSLRIRKPLKRSDFTPPPNVDTVLLEVKLLEEPFLDRKEMSTYYSFIAKCFQNQRFFFSLLKQHSGISPERKPSELTPEQWISLHHSSRSKY